MAQETLPANCLPHRKCSIFYEQLLLGDLGRGLVWPVSRAGSGAGQLYHLLLPSQILQSVLRHDFMNYSALSVEGGDQALSVLCSRTKTACCMDVPLPSLAPVGS